MFEWVWQPSRLVYVCDTVEKRFAAFLDRAGLKSAVEVPP